MTYTAQTSLRTQAASLGVVTAIHVGLAAALVIGLAAVGEIKRDERLDTFDVPQDQPRPAPQPSVKPDERRADSAQPNKVDVMIDVGPVRVDPFTETRVEPRMIPDAVPTATPTARGVFKPAAPRGRAADWATPDDYPPLDLRLDHEGLARFSLSIGADGRATSCTITGSSGFAGLDNATCTLVMRRARFNPALDEDGKPTTGSYSNAIRWVIPR